MLKTKLNAKDVQLAMNALSPPKLQFLAMKESLVLTTLKPVLLVLVATTALNLIKSQYCVQQASTHRQGSQNVSIVPMDTNAKF